LCPKSKALKSDPQTPRTPSEASYLVQASETQSLLTLLGRNLDDLYSLRTRCYTATTPADDRGLDSSLLSLTQITNGLLKRLVTLLPGEGSEAGKSQVEVNVEKVLQRRFRDRVLEYQKLQSEISALRSPGCGRQLQLFATEEEAEDSGAAEIARARLRDLQLLEQSISEMSQLFVEMSSLVCAQGEMIDSIEWSVINTKHFAFEAKKALVTARLKQHNNVKLTLYLLLACIILLAILILPLIFRDAIAAWFR
jgi:hypothetical protein